MGAATSTPDFGVAKVTQDDDEATGSGSIVGTPSYMSPEQVSGDVCSTGANTRCDGGSCSHSCFGATPTDCGGACVDLSKDALNCGACGVVGAAGAVCAGSSGRAYTPAVGCTACPCAQCAAYDRLVLLPVAPGTQGADLRRRRVPLTARSAARRARRDGREAVNDEARG